MLPQTPIRPSNLIQFIPKFNQNSCLLARKHTIAWTFPLSRGTLDGPRVDFDGRCFFFVADLLAGFGPCHWVDKCQDDHLSDQILSNIVLRSTLQGLLSQQKAWRYVMHPQSFCVCAMQVFSLKSCCILICPYMPVYAQSFITHHWLASHLYSFVASTTLDNPPGHPDLLVGLSPALKAWCSSVHATCCNYRWQFTLQKKPAGSEPALHAFEKCIVGSVLGWTVRAVFSNRLSTAWSFTEANVCAFEAVDG